MKNYIPKKQKRHLKELSKIAYERDIARCLGVVEEMFNLWRANDVSVWDLNDKIHEYHDEIARTLYTSYTNNDPIFSVSFGVANGVLSIDEVDESCRERVKSLSAAIRKIEWG